MIGKLVSQERHRVKRNLSMAWVDVKKAYDYPFDHKWLNEIMQLHRFPSYLRRVIRNLCANWNTRITVPTKQGNETSSTIRFSEGLPGGGGQFGRKREKITEKSFFLPPFPDCVKISTSVHSVHI